MSKFKTFRKMLAENPKRIKQKIISDLSRSAISHVIPDKIFLSFYYKAVFGKKLDLNNPRTFNEKLQWLKLYDRRTEYSTYVDKYEVRSYIAETIGDQYLIPLLGVYNDVDEIDWDKLPNQFVLKCTHGSNSNIICPDKSKLDIESSKSQLKKWMKKNWYWFGREWPYKNVKPRIICEKYMVDESGKELKDYKVFCFSGEPKLIQVDFDRFTDHKRNIYDTNWNLLPVEIKFPSDKSRVINKPVKLEDMLKFARILSKDYPHVRVDFYSIGEEIYFGEMTFFHGSGFERILPEEFNVEMGKWIKLPNA